MIEADRTCLKPSSSVRRRCARSAATGTSCSSARVLAAACGGGLRVQTPAGLHRHLAAIGDQRQRLKRRLAGRLAARPPRSSPSTFARVVQSTQVTKPVAKALHTTPAWVVAHVSGTPVPSSPFVTINANASTPGVATTAANAALKAVDRVRAQTRERVDASSSSLLATIRNYSIQLSRAETAVGHLKGQAATQSRVESELRLRPRVRSRFESPSAAADRRRPRQRSPRRRRSSTAHSQHTRSRPRTS